MTTETTQAERDKKLLQCLRALEFVKNDLGYMSLDEETRNEVEAAREPIGGWAKGCEPLKMFLDDPDD